MMDELVDDPFWEAAREGRLIFQQCDDCSYIRWPAAGVCPECLSRGWAWADVEGTGTVWSHVVYHRAYSKSGLSPIPYNVVLIELDCGPRLISRLVGEGSLEAQVGGRVTVQFAEVADHGVVPVFALTDDDGEIRDSSVMDAPALGHAIGRIS